MRALALAQGSILLTEPRQRSREICMRIGVIRSFLNIPFGDAFYWYGENKEFTTGKPDVWTWGVRCYRSTDLYNWEDLGLIVPPDMRNKSMPLHPSRLIDRQELRPTRQQLWKGDA